MNKYRSTFNNGYKLPDLQRSHSEILNLQNNKIYKELRPCNESEKELNEQQLYLSADYNIEYNENKNNDKSNTKTYLCLDEVINNMEESNKKTELQNYFESEEIQNYLDNNNVINVDENTKINDRLITIDDSKNYKQEYDYNENHSEYQNNNEIGYKEVVKLPPIVIPAEEFHHGWQYYDEYVRGGKQNTTLEKTTKDKLIDEIFTCYNYIPSEWQNTAKQAVLKGNLETMNKAMNATFAKVTPLRSIFNQF